MCVCVCIAGTTHVDAEFADICDAVAATQRIKHKTRLLLSKKHAPQLVGYGSHLALPSSCYLHAAHVVLFVCLLCCYLFNHKIILNN